MRVIVCLITILCASAFFAATQGAARAGSHCKNIRTVQQAAQAGEMPAIVAALHGGALPVNPLACAARQR